MQSIESNPQLIAVCNHFEEMYVINPKKGTYKSCNLMTFRLQSKRITYSLMRDYIQILRIR
ncbi:MAG: hypothetical protein UHN02_00360 [Acutalibacteraceae bacterium]|nr:hypothetical protein [Acutalibacteraceae bacterium]